MSSVVIVGAGIAGTLAARELVAHGHRVVVVDKARAPGGRVATRTVDGAVFDHGAQFLTARSERFQRQVDAWCAAGVARTWFHGSPDVDGPDDADGFPRFRGVPTMRRLVEQLAVGLDVRLGTVVRRVDATAVGWRLTASPRGGGSTVVLESDALLLTAPVPQTLALLDAGGIRLGRGPRSRLDAVRFAPCITVLARPHAPPALPPRGARRLADGDVDWLTDNHASGASPVPAITIHASATFSAAHLDVPDEIVGPRIVARARTYLGTDADVVAVHRWRFAAPGPPAGSASVLDTSNPGPVAIAGDGLAGGRIEGAALSGYDAADHLHVELSRGG